MEAPEKVMNNEKISSTSSEGRKSSKPIMEKRRRARINASLAELKSLLLEVMKSEGARQNKMEKADILEMTVRHLRQLQRQQYSALSTSDPAIINKYRLGFNECANEVSKFLGSLEGVDTEIRARLLNHLANCTTDTETAQNGHSETVDNCDKPVHASTHNIPIKPAIPSSINHGSNDNQRSTNQMSFTKTHVIGQPTVLPVENVLNSSTPEKNNNVFNAVPNILTSEKSVTICSGDISNPTVQVPKVFGGLQAIPTKLPSGEMAFIIPATNMMSCNTIPNYVIPVLQSPTVQISNTSGQVIPNTSPVHIQYSSNTNNTSHSDSVTSIVNGSAVIANSTTSVPISLPSSAFGLPAINNVATVPVNISYGMQRLPTPNTTNLASNPIFGSESVTNCRTGSSMFTDKQLRPKLNSDPLELPSMSIRNAENAGDQNRGHIHDLCNKQDDMWRPW